MGNAGRNKRWEVEDECVEDGCLCLREDGHQAAASASVHYKMSGRRNEPHISNSALNVAGPQCALNTKSTHRRDVC
jgi:hypothetical protein